MDNDRNKRIKEMTDAINKMRLEGMKTEYDFDDAAPQTYNTPRSERVASGMRSGSSSRVTSVDMSGINVSHSGSASSSGTRSAGTSAKAHPASGSRSASRSTDTSAARASEANTPSAIENTVQFSTVRSYSEVLEESQKRRSSSQTQAKRSPSGSSSSRTPAARTSSGSRKKTKSKKKSGSGFKKFLLIYSAVLVVIIIVVSIVLTSFLRNYEKNQPTNVAASVVSQFETPEKLRAFLEDNASITNQGSAILNFEDAFIAAVEGKKISYIEDPSRTTSEVTSYRITADSMPVASITLTKGDKGAFGLASWVLSGIDTSSAFSDVKTYSILVPEGSRVTVNGTELAESMISGTGIPEVLETSSQFIADPPTYTTYNVKVVSDTIDVSGTDATGANLVFSQTENSFVAGGQASDEFVDEVSERVEDGLREYALYFIYEAFNLEDYIVDGCELYAYIFGGSFGGEEYDPINPWLYNFEYIADYEFSTFEAKNYTRYSDDCFTVDVNYKLDIEFTEESYSDDNQKLDATWVWVKQNGQWYISSSKTH